MLVPTEPKLYHIVYVDRLSHIIRDGYLWCDAEMAQRSGTGTTIGIGDIKQRRLANALNGHPDLHVGECVPFYFCPRSVMLYVIWRANPSKLEYRGGQEPIIHLEVDLRRAVAWADASKRRWFFTLSNAGASYFQNYSDLGQLNKLDWQAIQASDWRECRERKQAEFLVERSFPWTLISRIGVHSRKIGQRVLGTVQASSHRPSVEIKPGWYY